MPADQDVYRKIGRGGAGNYYAPTKADQENNDLEAQNLDTAVAPPPDRSSVHAPTRAGRGGAGNYVDPASMPDPREQEAMADRTAAAVAASLRRSHQGRGGLGGRGGAGNWQTDEEEQQQQQQQQRKKGAGEDEKARSARLEREVKDAVDRELKMPAKVHHSP